MVDLSTVSVRITPVSEEAPAYGEGPDPERFWAWINLLQANRVVQDEMEERLQAAAGLTLAQHELLWRIAAAPEGKLRMNDLASLLLVSKSGVTRLVDRLVEMGFVERTACREDRRVVYAQITGAGHAALDRASPAHVEALERAFSVHLGDSDVRSLRRALRKVLEGNGAWHEERCARAAAEVPDAPAR